MRPARWRGPAQNAVTAPWKRGPGRPRFYPVRQTEQALSRLPLFQHATRPWATKIRGQLHYFGSWDDPDAALQKNLGKKEDLHAGRRPRRDASGALTVKGLANAFLNRQRGLLRVHARPT